MRKGTQVGILIIALVMTTGLIGASSFTTATLTRDTNIDVVSDTNGVIGLIDGNSGDVVQEDASTGELRIDFTVGSATGVNVDSVYELGDPANPVGASGERAFNITNNDGVSHTINISYSVADGTSGIGDGLNSTEFQVYDGTGANVATVSEEGPGGEFTAASGETFAVVVVVDTTPAGVDQTDDLSGTLTVTAT